MLGIAAYFCSVCVCGAVRARLIWITGWSVWTETMLKRKPMAAENTPTLGELLKHKAEQGVKVRHRLSIGITMATVPALIASALA